MDYPRHIVAVGGLISDPKGQVLLVRSPRRGWEFPGGQVEVGEDIVAALKREVEEETGIVAAIGRLVGVYCNTAAPTKVMFGFLGEAVSGDLRTSDESPEVGWFGRERALTLVEHPAIADRLRDMLEFEGRVRYRAYTTNPYEVHSDHLV